MNHFKIFPFNKNIIFIIMFFLLTSLFLSCENWNKPKIKAIPVRVAFWGSTEEVQIINDTIKSWQAKHPEIEVVLEHIPASGDISKYTSKILTEMAGDSGPDLFFCEVDMFVNFYLKKALLDLTPYINNDKEFDIKAFYPQVVQRFTRNNRIYVVPRDTAPCGVIFYNKDLLDEQGLAYPKDNWTWDDLVRMGKKLLKKDKNNIVIQYPFYTWAWQNFIYSTGGNFVDNVADPKQSTFNSAPVRRGLQFYYDLIYKYQIHPQIQSLPMGAQELFETGKLVMYGSGIWETPRFRKIKNFNWDVVAFPRTPEGKLVIATGGSGYGINVKTKHPQEAWEVLKCLAGDYGQIQLAKTGLAQPANMKIADSKYWAKNNEIPLHKDVVNTLVQYTVYKPFHHNWMEAFYSYVQPQVDLYLLNKQDLNTTLKKAEKGIKSLLKK